jgi:hypothetical protein
VAHNLRTNLDELLLQGRHRPIFDEFSRTTLWDHMSETEIDPRRCGRGRLRRLVNPEALGFPGHDKPVPHP